MFSKFRHTSPIQSIIHVLVLLQLVAASPCPSCPFAWMPPLEGRNRGEGLVGQTTTEKPAAQSSWSTEWTMKPWSWSSGSKEMAAVTEPAMPEQSGECKACEQNANGNTVPNMEMAKRQGFGPGRHFFRPPPGPGPGFGPPPPPFGPFWPPPPSPGGFPP